MIEPMTEARLAEIERRYGFDSIKSPAYGLYVRELIAEIRRLKQAIREIHEHTNVSLFEETPVLHFKLTVEIRHLCEEALPELKQKPNVDSDLPF